MDNNVRPETMERIVSSELAKAFIGCRTHGTVFAGDTVFNRNGFEFLITADGKCDLVGRNALVNLSVQVYDKMHALPFVFIFLRFQALVIVPLFLRGLSERTVRVNHDLLDGAHPDARSCIPADRKKALRNLDVSGLFHNAAVTVHKNRRNDLHQNKHDQ